jgi:AcrR family transcriptional regulator
VSEKREYRSSLREEGARETRLRIRRAARDLFAERGFSSTTVSDIASRAGVAAATVYATYESKAGIVTAMLDEMEEGAGAGGRLQALLAEPDPTRQLRMWVAAHCALFAHGVDVLEAAMQAAGDPQVRRLAEAGDAHRREIIDRLAGRWSEGGALRADMSPDEAAERMWLLTTLESFLTATRRLGWPPERYREWLTGLLEREILRSGEDARPPRREQGSPP